MLCCEECPATDVHSVLRCNATKHSMLASGNRVRGFEPGRSGWIFRASEKSSACLPTEGKWKNLSHVPALRHVKEPSTSVNYECASKIPCIVPSFASRVLSCLCGAWRLWKWMRGTHWGQGYNRPTGCSAGKAPHATFNFLTHLVPVLFTFYIHATFNFLTHLVPVLFTFYIHATFNFLTYLVPVLLTFYIQGVLKFKNNNSGAKRLILYRPPIFASVLETGDKKSLVANSTPTVTKKEGLSFCYEMTAHVNLFYDRTLHMGFQQQHSKAIAVAGTGSTWNLKSEVEQTHVPDNEDDMNGISQYTNWPRTTSHSPWVVWRYSRVKDWH